MIIGGGNKGKEQARGSGNRSRLNVSRFPKGRGAGRNREDLTETPAIKGKK